MIVRKRVSISRETGEVISEEILGTINMTRDEYWEPFIRIVGPDIIREFLEQEARKNRLLNDDEKEELLNGQTSARNC